jgi:hypothetical protein
MELRQARAAEKFVNDTNLLTAQPVKATGGTASNP